MSLLLCAADLVCLSDLRHHSQVERSSSERKLKEITRGSGGMCGSAYIDNNLRELLIQKMGEHAGKISPCTMENVMQEFTEQIKVRNAIPITYHCRTHVFYM